MHDPSGGARELLVAAVTDDGGRRQWRTPLMRGEGGELVLGETVREDGMAPDFMDSVRRVWVALGRDKN